jgi:hypothetical protein
VLAFYKSWLARCLDIWFARRAYFDERWRRQASNSRGWGLITHLSFPAVISWLMHGRPDWAIIDIRCPNWDCFAEYIRGANFGIGVVISVWHLWPLLFRPNYLTIPFAILQDDLPAFISLLQQE